MDHYREESRLIMQIIAQTGAVVEAMSIDKAYLVNISNNGIEIAPFQRENGPQKANEVLTMETLPAARQWPVVTFQAVPGDRAGRALARPPNPRLLEEFLCT